MRCPHLLHTLLFFPPFGHGERKHLEIDIRGGLLVVMIGSLK